MSAGDTIYNITEEGDVHIAGDLFVNDEALLGTILGDRQYTQSNYIASLQTLTASIDALDIGLNNLAIAPSIWTDAGTYIHPTTAGANSLTILDSGNVGIGTTGPGAKLDIRNTLNVADDDIDQNTFYSYSIINPTEAIDTDYKYARASYTEINIPSSNTTDLSKIYLYGPDIYVTNNGDGNIGRLAGLASRVYNYSDSSADISFMYGVGSVAHHYGSGTVGTLIGTYVSATAFQDGISGTATNIYGNRIYSTNYANNSGTSTSTNIYGDYITAYSYANNSGTATVDTMYGTYIEAGAIEVNSGNSSITDVYSIYLNNGYSDNSGDVTNAYGLYIEDITHGDSLNYNIYSAGTTGINYFGSNVGIGTTSPSQELEVRSDQNGLTFAQVTNATAGTSARAGYSAYNDSGGDISLQVLSSSHTEITDFLKPNYGVLGIAASLDGLNIVTTDSNDPIAFFTNSLERLRIDGNGNVGIGTTGPGAKLDIDPGTNNAIDISGTLDQDDQKGLNITISADTDGDDLYGLYNTVDVGTGTLSTADRNTYGVYNDVTNNTLGSGAPNFYRTRAYGVYNKLTQTNDSGNGQPTYTFGLKNDIYLDSNYSKVYAIQNIIESHTATNSEVYLIDNTYNSGTFLGDSSSLYGLKNNLSADGNNQNVYAVRNILYAAGSAGETETLYGAYTSLRSTNSDQALYGVFVDDYYGISTAGTQYGVYIDLDDTDVTNWGIYEAGGATNYFAGDVGIGTTGPSSALDVVGDIEVGNSDSLYFGDPSTDNTWRIVRDGNNLVFQRRESGSYVTKDTITP